MTNHPATPKEVYDSICEAIQKQINLLANQEITLSQEQVADIVKKIGRFNGQLEDYAKRLPGKLG